ncbi:retrotransposon protein, partial [Trifolium medium]|nr:retrotransposon protein [Trifolium medium]
MQPPSIPKWKWDNIFMDLVTSLPKTATGHDSMWVIVQRQTKSAHFMPTKITTPLPKLAEIYINMIVKLHGILSSIVSDRDPRFTS